MKCPWIQDFFRLNKLLSSASSHRPHAAPTTLVVFHWTHLNFLYWGVQEIGFSTKTEYENISVFDNASIIIVVTHCSRSENGSSSLVREEKSSSTDSSSVSWPLPARKQLQVTAREPGPLINQMMDRRLVLHRNCETEFRSSCITLAKCCSSLGKWG